MTIDKCLTCKHAFITGKDRLYCKKLLADKDDCGEYKMAIDAQNNKTVIKELSHVKQEPKTGHWISREDMDYIDENKVTNNHFMCKDCGFIHNFIDGHTSQYNFCPNCGCGYER